MYLYHPEVSNGRTKCENRPWGHPHLTICCYYLKCCQNPDPSVSRIFSLTWLLILFFILLFDRKLKWTPTIIILQAMNVKSSQSCRILKLRPRMLTKDLSFLVWTAFWVLLVAFIILYYILSNFGILSNLDATYASLLKLIFDKLQNCFVHIFLIQHFKTSLMLKKLTWPKLVFSFRNTFVLNIMEIFLELLCFF